MIVSHSISTNDLSNNCPFLFIPLHIFLTSSSISRTKTHYQHPTRPTHHRFYSLDPQLPWLYQSDTFHAYFFYTPNSAQTRSSNSRRGHFAQTRFPKPRCGPAVGESAALKINNNSDVFVRRTEAYKQAKKTRDAKDAGMAPPGHSLQDGRASGKGWRLRAATFVAAQSPIYQSRRARIEGKLRHYLLVRFKRSLINFQPVFGVRVLGVSGAVVFGI